MPLFSHTHTQFVLLLAQWARVEAGFVYPRKRYQGQGQGHMPSSFQLKTESILISGHFFISPFSSAITQACFVRYTHHAYTGRHNNPPPTHAINSSSPQKNNSNACHIYLYILHRTKKQYTAIVVFIMYKCVAPRYFLCLVDRLEMKTIAKIIQSRVSGPLIDYYEYILYTQIPPKH